MQRDSEGGESSTRESKCGSASERPERRVRLKAKEAGRGAALGWASAMAQRMAAAWASRRGEEGRWRGSEPGP